MLQLIKPLNRVVALVKRITDNNMWGSSPCKLFSFCIKRNPMETSSLIQEHPALMKVTLDLQLLDHPPAPIFDCLIILNYRFKPWLLSKFITRAKTVIATDGGANFLYNSEYRDVPTLHTILGDLDSLKPQIRSYYEKKNVNVIQDLSQDTNDFMKSIRLAHELKLTSLVSIGTLGGRIDQQLCNLSAIQQYSEIFPQRFIALGPSSLMFLIKGGEEATVKLSKSCNKKQSGMFCFGKSKVNSEGFRWNLNPNENELEWGKFISSSNHILQDEVRIRTENRMFFTIEFDNDHLQL